MTRPVTPLTQRIMAPPLLGGIQAGPPRCGSRRYGGDTRVIMPRIMCRCCAIRESVASRLWLMSREWSMTWERSNSSRSSLTVSRTRCRCDGSTGDGGSRPFLIRGGRIRRWRLLVSFHAQGSPFRLPADIPARLQLLEIGHLSFPGIRHRKRHAKQDTQRGLRSMSWKRTHRSHAGKMSVPGMMRQYGQNPERYRPVASRALKQGIENTKKRPAITANRLFL